MATHQSVEDLAKRCQNLIILGDFNSPDICWATLHGSSPSSRFLCDLIFQYQMIHSPTHTGGNLLITNIDYHISNITTHDNLATLSSDHVIITFDVRVSTSTSFKRRSCYVLNYSKADFDGLNDYLLSIDFNLCFTAINTDEIWSKLKDISFPMLPLSSNWVHLSVQNGSHPK